MLLEAKHIHEAMDLLIHEVGDMLIDDYNIMKEMHRRYGTLFRAKNITKEVDLAMEEMIQYTSNRIDATTKGQIEEIPTIEEITNTLKQLPKNVSPGIDGLTNKVCVACMDFMKMDFYKMPINFWGTGFIICKVKDGVIKLVPKSLVKLRAKD